MRKLKFRISDIVKPWVETCWHLNCFNKKSWTGDDEVISSLVGHIHKPIAKLVRDQEKFWKEEAKLMYNNRDYWRDKYELKEKQINKFKERVDKIDVSGGGSGRRIKIQLLDLINKL